MKIFIRWFIIISAMLTGVCIAENFNLLSLIYQNDVSYLSVVISLLFIIGSVIVGKLSWDLDKNKRYRLVSPGFIKNIEDETAKILQIPSFIAENLVTLGLFGTLIGFSIILHSALNETDVNLIINTLKNGTGVALYTTLTGLICSLLLQLQIFVLKYHLDE